MPSRSAWRSRPAHRPVASASEVRRGESVWIKAGVTVEEPLAVLDDSYLRMNIDHGNLSRGHVSRCVH